MKIVVNKTIVERLTHPHKSIDEFIQSIGDIILRVKGEKDFEL